MPTYIGLCFDENFVLLNNYLDSFEKIYIDLLDLEYNNSVDENEFDYQFWEEQRSLRIENVLGICFLLAQNFITSIVSLSKRYINQTEKSRSTNIGKRFLIGSTFCENIPNYCFTTIEAIDAIANYYKHNEEWIPRWHNGWHDEWESKKEEVRRTIEIVEALGIRQQKMDSIQCACECMNLGKGKIFKEILGLLKKWSKKVEIERDNLVTLYNLQYPMNR